MERKQEFNMDEQEPSKRRRVAHGTDTTAAGDVASKINAPSQPISNSVASTTATSLLKALGEQYEADKYQLEEPPKYFAHPVRITSLQRLLSPCDTSSVAFLSAMAKTEYVQCIPVPTPATEDDFIGVEDGEKPQHLLYLCEKRNGTCDMVCITECVPVSGALASNPPCAEDHDSAAQIKAAVDASATSYDDFLYLSFSDESWDHAFAVSMDAAIEASELHQTWEDDNAGVTFITVFPPAFHTELGFPHFSQRLIDTFQPIDHWMYLLRFAHVLPEVPTWEKAPEIVKAYERLNILHWTVDDVYSYCKEVSRFYSLNCEKGMKRALKAWRNEKDPSHLESRESLKQGLLARLDPSSLKQFLRARQSAAKFSQYINQGSTMPQRSSRNSPSFPAPHYFREVFFRDKESFAVTLNGYKQGVEMGLLAKEAEAAGKEVVKEVKKQLPERAYTEFKYLWKKIVNE